MVDFSRINSFVCFNTEWKGLTMNSKKAKYLRKKIYGDFSQREERKYIRTQSGSIRTTGRRAQYQKAKGELK
jgi:hypothetical protein